MLPNALFASKSISTGESIELPARTLIEKPANSIVISCFFMSLPFLVDKTYLAISKSPELSAL